MAGRRGRAIYATQRWRSVRAYVLDRDGWRCAECGRPGRLEVHHRVRLVDGGAPYDPRNLRPLCRPCHFATHAAPTPERAEWAVYLEGQRAAV